MVFFFVLLSSIFVDDSVIFFAFFSLSTALLRTCKEICEKLIKKTMNREIQRECDVTKDTLTHVQTLVTIHKLLKVVFAKVVLCSCST